MPVRDEVDSLEPLHRELDAAVGGIAGGVEWIFVDDGSTDGSAERLRDLARKDARLRLLRLGGHRGQSAAFLAGFRAARGEITATLDADLQNDPADLPRLLERLPGADVVCGVRTRRRDPAWRRWTSRVANAARNAATGESVRDVGCSLRVARTGTLRRVPPFRGVHRFLPTFLRLEGARVVEVPVSHRPRRSGRSKQRTAERRWAGLVDLAGVRWLEGRWLPDRAVEWEREEPAPASGGGIRSAAPGASGGGGALSGDGIERS